MIPILTPEEMAAADAAATEPVEVLIDRAGRAVARAALDLMGGAYGRRVLIVAGPGNNGADGRSAAGRLRRRGVRCHVVGPGGPVPAGKACEAFDLVIDAAFGTGLRRPYEFPAIPPDVAVLAVDIASAVDGLSGELRGRPVPADRTVSFAALKPGHVLDPGRSYGGELSVADIGLDATGAGAGVPEPADVAAVLPRRSADAHKWRSAMRVVGGSASMQGAASLAATAASRVGAGLVQLAMPGTDGPAATLGAPRPVEAVGWPLPASGWGADAAAGSERLKAVLAGPGLGRSGPGVVADLAALCDTELPLVLDGDALLPEILDRVARRSAPTVLTPHEGEWRRLGGSGDPDRLRAARCFAHDAGAVVVRKGPTTIVAAPHGVVRVVTEGSPVLATAGTGDVLAGAIAGLIAAGADAFEAAWSAAWLHAAAGNTAGPGAVAGELPALLAAVAAGVSRPVDSRTAPPAGEGGQPDAASQRR